MSAFLTVNGVEITSVCMICHQIIGDDHRPTGRYPIVPTNLSHGLCLNCAPGYCKEQGLTDAETARIIKNQGTASAVSVSTNN